MSTAQSHHRYTTTIGGLKSLWKTEGLAGYFRGTLPKILSRGPISALSAVMYEMILYYSRKDVDLTFPWQNKSSAGIGNLGG
jgi:hypothetical protein